MKIIKRNGTEVAFDPEKIANAVRKANNEVSEDNRLTEEQIDKITKKVTALANDLNRAVNVEEVQDFVENQIMSEKAFAVARKYITSAAPTRRTRRSSRSSSATTRKSSRKIPTRIPPSIRCSATIWRAK